MTNPIRNKPHRVILLLACILTAWAIMAPATLRSQSADSLSSSSPLAVAPTFDHYIFLPLIQRPDPNFYVALNGNDNNSGKIDAPWRTLQKAADAAPPGVVVYIRAGTYAGFQLTRSGLSFAAYPGETVLVEGDGIDTHTIEIKNASNVAIRNLTVENNLLQYGTGIHVESASQITIAGSTLRDNQGFGVVFKNVSNSLIENNDVTANGSGLEVRYGSAGVMIHNNRIYQNYRDVDAGRGGTGVTFYYTTGPLTAADNQIWSNHTISKTIPDGVGFEIYAASNFTITQNLMWDNQTILETGTDAAKTPCDSFTFTRNIAYRINWQQGLILRCASNSLITQNTFDGLDTFVYDLSDNSGPYGASIENLRILNNIAVNGRVYSIDTAIPASVVIDYNLNYNPGTSLAYVVGLGNTNLLSVFQSWTGYDLHGLTANPLFVDEANRDYHLTAGSPAIDKGTNLGEAYNGSAPDLGRFEYP